MLDNKFLWHNKDLVQKMGERIAELLSTPKIGDKYLLNVNDYPVAVDAIELAKKVYETMTPKDFTEPQNNTYRIEVRYRKYFETETIVELGEYSWDDIFIDQMKDSETLSLEFNDGVTRDIKLSQEGKALPDPAEVCYTQVTDMRTGQIVSSGTDLPDFDKF